MVGLSACVDFIKDWKINSTDVTILQGVESISNLPQAFWTYLLSLENFSGIIQGLPDGEIMGLQPITATPALLEMYGEKPIQLDLIQIEGNSAEVALISEGFATILDFSIHYSRNLLSYKLSGQRPMFFESEREIHPFWAHLGLRLNIAWMCRTR